MHAVIHIAASKKKKIRIKMINEDTEVQEAYHEYIEARVEALAKVNR